MIQTGNNDVVCESYTDYCISPSANCVASNGTVECQCNANYVALEFNARSCQGKYFLG